MTSSTTDPEVTEQVGLWAGGQSRNRIGASSRHSSLIGLLVVLAVPLFDNLAAILHLVRYEPQASTSGIGLISKVGFLPGKPYLDPNVGYNSQAIGHAVALGWIHGHVPWWNLNEGLGMPLAASIQSASFFPVTLLQGLPDGSLWFHVAIECMIGWATYALLRQLRCSPFAAAVGAIAFELNGAIAWLTNAPANPVAFLPLCLLGVEYVVSASAARRRGGWIVLALGVWLSIVSGFPEVAVLNSALVALWFAVRVAQRPHDAGRTLLRGATGVAVGLLLAAPVLNAFVRYLRVANIGLHQLALSSLTIPKAGLAQLVSPYVFGGIFDTTDPTVLESWTRIGGYAGFTLLVLSCAGLFGARERLLRFVLGGWALLFLGSAYNLPVAHQIVTHLPGLSHLAVYRYATASSLFCLCVLAALFLNEAASLRATQLVARTLPGIVLGLTLFLIGFIATDVGRTWARINLPKWYWGSLLLLVVVVAAVVLTVVLAVTPLRPYVPVVLGILLAVEAMGFFMVPILAFPRAVTYDTEVVDYLHAHLGTQRYFTIEPISPNYGSYYGVASLDAADLPVPKNWAAYVHTSLNSCILPWQFGNSGATCPNGSTPLEQALIHLPAYENSGVKFLLTQSSTHLSKYFQPRLGISPATPDGGSHLLLTWAPPSFLPGATLTGLTIGLHGGVPSTLKTTVCSGSQCNSALPTGATQGGEGFSLVAPLPLSNTLVVKLASSNADPVQVLTVAGASNAPATVVADGVLLPDRAAVAHFVYDPTSVPRLVARTTAANIYLLPHPAPLATAPGCTITMHTTTTFTASCASPSVLTYRGLFFSGWSASVSGHAATISPASSVFQRITVPQGVSQVAFTYEPPDTTWAWIAALLGVAAIAVGLVRRQRVPRTFARTGAGGGPPTHTARTSTSTATATPSASVPPGSPERSSGDEPTGSPWQRDEPTGDAPS